MKTLADLKRNANKFQWSLVKNSWFDGIPEHQKAYRDIGTVQTQRFTLLTNKDGELIESWMDWPKANELTIIPVVAHGVNMGYEVIINRETGAVNTHEMIYFLRHKQEVKQ